MKDALSVVLFILWSISELANMYLIAKYFSLLEPRKKSKYRIVASVIMQLLITMIFSIGVISDYKILVVLMFIPFLMKSIFVISQLYRVKIKTGFAFICFSVVNSSIASNISIVERFLESESYPIRNIACELIASIFFLLIFIILVIMKKKTYILIYFEELKYTDYLLFIITLYAITMLEVSMFSSIHHSDIGRLVSVIAFWGVVNILARSIVNIATNKKLLYEKALLEAHVKYSKIYYENLIEINGATKKFRHDIKNLLVALQALISEKQNEKAIDYISKLQIMANEGTAKYNSGNFVADAIISTKSRIAEKNDTDIILDGCIPNAGISDVDLVIILSNILDNAIEACESIAGHKIVNIKSVQRKNIWLLTVANPSNEVIIENNSIIKTNKVDKDNHGFGLMNVRKIVEQYNGVFEVKYINDSFYTKIRLLIN